MSEHPPIGTRSCLPKKFSELVWTSMSQSAHRAASSCTQNTLAGLFSHSAHLLGSWFCADLSKEPPCRLSILLVPVVLHRRSLMLSADSHHMPQTLS